MGTTLELALASQSPRRRDLLQEAGFSFRVFPVKVSEIFDENLNAGDQASQLATLKASAALEQHKELKRPGFLVLGADTIVVVGGRQLGKPENSAQAAEYLRLLSGKTHSVITGVTLLESGSSKSWTGFVETFVGFRSLDESEISAYIATGEPMDKAGGYAIQGLANKFVSKVKGSWSNVVGLPLERLDAVLKENGWNVHRAKSR